MCILFIAVNQHPDYPVVIAANRDEFYGRPTQTSHFWDDYPDILAGRDLQSGGTWMGLNRQGYIAALTNFRDPKMNNPEAPSRGHLVSDFLKRPSTNYADSLVSTRSHYNGYNLLYGKWSELAVYNNVENTHNKLGSGVYGLSNANLDTPWPKLTSGVDALSKYLNGHKKIEMDGLFRILADRSLAAEQDLPDTGISKAWEKALSSIFIHLETYGTRSSTLLLIDRNESATWCERTFSNDGQMEQELIYDMQISR